MIIYSRPIQKADLQRIRKDSISLPGNELCITTTNPLPWWRTVTVGDDSITNQ
ncbi:MULTISPECIES: hypothetical protein [unclassified Endozoicomonas]|uniref:hypothetical protein n=1 Tax=unclassified Endozoicomonas TaxID=2644528 RepID=UPI0021486ABF|nr:MULTISPECIES: hypothetical protein [unclassified Endozoicomonas]